MTPMSMMMMTQMSTMMMWLHHLWWWPWLIATWKNSTILRTILLSSTRLQHKHSSKLLTPPQSPYFQSPVPYALLLLPCFLQLPTLAAHPCYAPNATIPTSTILQCHLTLQTPFCPWPFSIPYSQLHSRWCHHGKTSSTPQSPQPPYIWQYSQLVLA